MGYGKALFRLGHEAAFGKRVRILASRVRIFESLGWRGFSGHMGRKELRELDIKELIRLLHVKRSGSWMRL